MTEHVALPVVLPDLTTLSDEQLASLRAKIIAMSREHRRKANASIGKVEPIRKAWGRMLGMNGSTPDDERKQIMQEFERELLPYPAIYISHAMANALVLLDTACRDEGLRRSPVGAGSKRRSVR